MRPWPADRIAFGGDYNPEQWPRTTWHEDMELMRAAGVSFVTLGVFSWSWLEPANGEYDFAWLDEVMGLLHESGIAVDLATATATPPPWLSAAHPEILPVDRDGHTLWPGSRQAWCPSSPVYREHALALTAQLARRYHEHPAIALWHVSNEYACHNLPCFCDTCAAAFRGWLRGRYGALEALNDAWGTAFWSQRYTDWDQVLPPRRTTTFPTRRTSSTSPGSAPTRCSTSTGRRRPSSPSTPRRAGDDELHDPHQLPAPRLPRLGPEQDVVSTDHYVIESLEHPRAELAFGADLTRGLAGGAPWMLMEHSTSAVNWQPVNRAKAPGQTIRDSLAHVARGADAIGFFQWRQSLAGSEKFHSALVPHAGRDSARFREVCELGAIAARLGELRGSRVEADVAVLWDYQAGWAASGPAMPSADLEYSLVGQTIHRLLRDRGITADVVHPGADPTAYRLIVVPTLYLVRDEHAAAIAAAAEAGAEVLVTFFSGISDEHDHVRLGGYPGAFRDLLGVRAEEFFPLLPGESVALSDGVGRLWSEDLTAAAAEVLSTYAAGPRGAPRHHPRRRGAGQRVVPQHPPGRPDARRPAGAGGRRRRSGPPPDVAQGVEAVRRRSEEGSWLFLANDTAAEQTVTASGHDLVADRPVGPVVLRPGAVAVVREA